MEDAFYLGYLDYMLGVGQPRKHLSDEQCWAWDLGWRLHRHLMRRPPKEIQAPPQKT